MSTLTKFGVPLGGGSGRGSILQPIQQWKFRVRFVNFGPIAGGLELTQQVVSCTAPKINSPDVEVHSYNSTMYIPGKRVFDPITLVLRNDVTSVVANLVGHQEQKQMNHLEQTTTLSGQNFKWSAYLEPMDGGNDSVLQQWYLEGCYMASVDYGEFNYSANDINNITMTIRYDNATMSGAFVQIPQFIPGTFVGQ